MKSKRAPFLAHNSTVSCLNCGLIICVEKLHGRPAGRLINCRSIINLFQTPDMYEKFFGNAGERNTNIESPYLCLPCYSHTMKLTERLHKSYLNKKPTQDFRKFRTHYHKGKIMMMALCQARLQYPPGLFQEHSYTELQPGDSRGSQLVLSREFKGHFKLESNCINCGNELEYVVNIRNRFRRLNFRYLYELTSLEDCKDVLKLESDLTIEQKSVYTEAKLCVTCTNYVISRCKPSIPVQKPKRTKVYQLAAKLINSRRYKPAFRMLIGKSRAAKKAFATLCCDLLTKEIRQFSKTDSVFSRKVTQESLSWFSLEEAGVSAKEISPFVVEVLQAMFPTPLRRDGTPNDHLAETVINSRLGLTLGIILYTVAPTKFKYIPSCLGVELRERDTSATVIDWLNQAGVSCSVITAQRINERLLAEAHPEVPECPRDSGNQIEDMDQSTPPSEASSTDPVSSVLETLTASQTDLKKFPCSKCSKSFKSKVSLVSHSLSHKTIKPHRCKVCGKSFLLMGNFLNHGCFETTGQAKLAQPEKRLAQGKFKSLFIPKESLKTYTCPICGKIVGWNSTLKRHVKTMHTERPYMCRVCLKTYTSEGLLQTHIQQSGHTDMTEVMREETTKNAKPPRKASSSTAPKALSSTAPKPVRTRRTPKPVTDRIQPFTDSAEPDSVVRSSKKKRPNNSKQLCQTTVIQATEVCASQQKLSLLSSAREVTTGHEPIETRMDSAEEDKVVKPKKRRRKTLKSLSNDPDSQSSICEFSSSAASVNRVEVIIPEKKRRKAPKRIFTAKKRRKPPENLSKHVEESVSTAVDGEPSVPSISEIQPNLNSDDTGQSCIHSEMQAIGVQNLLSQLDDIQGDQSEYLQLVAVPMGMSTEEGYISLEGVIDWSGLTNPDPPN